MARVIRRCSNCGATDARRSWASLDKAADQGAFDENWTCSNCAWSEFELVEETQQEPAQR